MIKIAVVDDDELICKEIVRLISKFNVCYDFDFLNIIALVRKYITVLLVDAIMI